MELTSVDAAASWHPFTSLVGLQSLAPDRGVSLMPVIDISPRIAVSDLLHEATHLWSARVSRFGWWLAAEGGPLLANWRADPGARVEVPRPTLVQLGTITPVLEGLALYAQLDYEEPRDGAGPVFGPLQALRELLALDMRNPRDPFTLYRGFREFPLCGGMYGRMPLLHALFADPRADTEHYFTGYLYVKALAAHLSSRFPPLRDRPDWLLPLMLKLVGDSPALFSQPGRIVGATSALQRMHAAILGLDLPAVLTALLRDDVREWFDWWDIYGQGQSVRSEVVTFDFESELRRLGVDPSSIPDEMFALRAAAQVHFLDWHTGTVEVDERGRALLKRRAGEPVAILGTDLKALHGDTERAAAYQAALGRASDVGAEVTLASFLTLNSGVPGAALWSADLDPAAAWWYPFDELDDIDEALCAAAFAFNPSDRITFADALLGRATSRRACWEASDWIASQLVADAALADDMRRLRFRSASLRRVREQALAYCDPHPMRPAGWSPPEEVAAVLEGILDLPGFAVDGAVWPDRARSLLPRLFPPGSPWQASTT